jgi:hypothetical protein
MVNLENVVHKVYKVYKVHKVILVLKVLLVLLVLKGLLGEFITPVILMTSLSVVGYLLVLLYSTTNYYAIRFKPIY